MVQANAKDNGQNLATRLEILRNKPEYKVNQWMLKNKAPEDLTVALRALDQKAAIQFPESYDWLNTIEGRKLSFDRELRGKFVIIDFWTSCCINCLHM